MKKLIILSICCLFFSVGYASVPKTNNHGFVLNNQTKTEKIVTEKENISVESTSIVKSKPNKSITSQKHKKIPSQKMDKDEVKVLVKEYKTENSKKIQINNSPEKNLLPEKTLGNGGLVILAIFFPLLAVLIGFGLKKEFWICLLLHLLALIPAWIYAIVVLSR